MWFDENLEHLRVTDIDNLRDTISRETLWTSFLQKYPDGDLRSAEEARTNTTSIAKTLVLSLPESMNVVDLCLSRFDRSWDYDLHFSIFCFLDAIQDWSECSNIRSSVLQSLKNYLHQVPQTTSHAAWMCGDLLGDHWVLSESLPILLRAVRHSMYEAGGVGALHGIAMALGSEELDAMMLDTIVLTLKEVQTLDHHSLVGLRAESMLARVTST